MGTRTGQTHMITARLRFDLVERLDAHLKCMQAQVPAGVRLNRTDAVAALLTEALDRQAEAKPARRKAKP